MTISHLIILVISRYGKFLGITITRNLSRVEHEDGVSVLVAELLLRVGPLHRENRRHRIRSPDVETSLMVLDLDDVGRLVVKVGVGAGGGSGGRLVNLVFVAARDGSLPAVDKVFSRISFVREERVDDQVGQCVDGVGRGAFFSHRKHFRFRRQIARRQDDVDDGVDQRLVQKFVRLGVEVVLLCGLAARSAVANCAVLLGRVGRARF